jgi:hypothetical protein
MLLNVWLQLVAVSRTSHALQPLHSCRSGAAACGKHCQNGAKASTRLQRNQQRSRPSSLTAASSKKAYTLRQLLEQQIRQ